VPVSLLLAVLCLWMLLVALFRSHPAIDNRINNAALMVAFAAVATWQAATSQSTVYDRVIYMHDLAAVGEEPTPWDYPGFGGRPLFSTFLWGLANWAPQTRTVLFGAVALVMSLCFLYAMRKVLSPGGALFAWVTLMASGFFLAYSTVTIRQGLAAAALTVAVALYVTSSRRAPFLVAIVAGGLLHWSAIPLGVGLALLRLGRVGWRPLLIAWSALAVAFILGVQSWLLGPVQGWIPKLDEYAAGDTFARYGSSGNRLTFLAVSAALALVALWGKRTTSDPRYARLATAYLLFNCMFLLLGFVAYSDRLASYSWFLGPLLLWYPLDVRRRGWAWTGTVATAIGVIVAGFVAGPFLTQPGA